VVEPGWRVLDADGEEIGRVAEIRGDPEQDIFSGLVVSPGMVGQSRYVRSDQVARITAEAVVVAFRGDDLEEAPSPEDAPG